MRKRVILFIIDALSSRYCVPALKEGRLPNLAKLVDSGFLCEESVSIFPSLTPAATSTIATGCYPREHGVLGFHWYDREKQEVAYYGDDFWIVNAMGFGKFFDGCIRQLNAERMKATTIFETLADRTKMRSASLNFLIFRGRTQHKATIPLWFSWHPSVPFKEELMGPDELFFGDFVTGKNVKDSDLPDRDSGILGRFGFNDDSTAALVRHFATNDLFPDFTLAYFPDHDWKAHDVGLEAALPEVEQFDSELGKLFDAYGGAANMLKEFCIVVTGDHSQSEVDPDKDNARISMAELLQGHDLDDSGSWDENRIKVFCDMRCAQIYLPKEDSKLKEDLTTKVLAEGRVDQVIWREETGGFIAVKTLDRGSCQFRLSNSDSDVAVSDIYGNCWEVRGELAALDATVEGGKLVYGDYPNALERIWGGVSHPSSANLWLTARLGFEFVTEEVKAHVGGGSHGSLHRLDSLSPIIVGGAKSVESLPASPRLTDIYPLCLELLQVKEPK